MDVDTLRAFLLVTSEGTIAQAAPRMFLSVSALSRRLQDLERELGVRLFDRTSRGLVVNQAGERLVDHATAVVAAADALADAVTGHQDVPSVQLGLCPGIDVGLRRSVVAALQAASGAKVRFVPGHNIALIRQLGLGQLDAALLHQDAGSARFGSVLVASEPTMIMFSESSPQAGIDKPCLADFAGESFVTSGELMTGAPVFYARLRSIFAGVGIDDVIDVGNAMWIRDMVSSGIGFGIFAGSSRLSAGAPEAGGVRACEVPDLNLALETYLAWPRNTPGPVTEHVIRAVTHRPADSHRAVLRS